MLACIHITTIIIHQVLSFVTSFRWVESKLHNFFATTVLLYSDHKARPRILPNLHQIGHIHRRSGIVDLAIMIVLALIAKGSNILAETHDPAHDRFLPAAQTILSRIPPNSSKLSYAFEDWLFHYVSQDGMVYMAVADAGTGRRMPFTFLAHIQKHFLSTYDVPEAGDSDMDYSSLTTTLSKLIKQFNSDPQAVDPIAQAKTELAGVKDIMTQNVEQILSRGERIELLMDRTDNAANQSMAFRRRAVGLRRQMWWKNAKVMALAGFSGLVFLFFLWGMFR